MSVATAALAGAAYRLNTKKVGRSQGVEDILPRRTLPGREARSYVFAAPAPNVSWPHGELQTRGRDRPVVSVFRGLTEAARQPAERKTESIAAFDTYKRIFKSAARLQREPGLGKRGRRYTNAACCLVLRYRSLGKHPRSPVACVEGEGYGDRGAKPAFSVPCPQPWHMMKGLPLYFSDT